MRHCFKVLILDLLIFLIHIPSRSFLHPFFISPLLHCHSFLLFFFLFFLFQHSLSIILFRLFTSKTISTFVSFFIFITLHIWFSKLGCIFLVWWHSPPRWRFDITLRNLIAHSLNIIKQCISCNIFFIKYLRILSNFSAFFIVFTTPSNFLLINQFD